MGRDASVLAPRPFLTAIRADFSVAASILLLLKLSQRAPLAMLSGAIVSSRPSRSADILHVGSALDLWATFQWQHPGQARPGPCAR